MIQTDARWPDSNGEMAGRIRAHDWAATPLGSIKGWSERLKVLVEHVLASPLVSSLACGPHYLLIYNDAAARLYGDQHPAALGRPLPDTFPTGWAIVAPAYQRAFAGETVRVRDQPLDTRGEGVATDMFDALLTPVREVSGQVTYVHMTGAEVGDRTQVEAALRASEEKFRSLFETMGQGYSEQEIVRDKAGRAIDIRLIEANARLEVLTGLPRAATVGKLFSKSLPGLEPAWIERMDRVVLSGEPGQFENEVAALGRWYNVHAYPRGGDRYALLYDDITDRKQAEIALHQSEERQAYLLKLSDDIRAQPNESAIGALVMHRLAEHLQLDRCYLAQMYAKEDRVIVGPEYHRSDLGAASGEYRLSDFPEVVRRVQTHTVVIDDVPDDPLLTEDDKTGLGAINIGAFVTAGVRRGNEEVLWALVVMSRNPRAWTGSEVTLVEYVAERTWAAIERVRGETALRESEERFAQFAASSSDALWIRDAATLAMEYTSPAIQTIYGIPPDAILGDMQRWLDLIVPEDRETAISHIEQAQAGASVTHEFRIQRPVDGEQRWIRNIDFPLRDASGRVQRIGGIAEDVTEAKRAGIRLEVLINELQHRARNLLGVVTAIADRTVKQGGSVEAFEERMQALSRAQGLLSQGGSDTVEVGALVRSELAAHANGAAGRVSIAGPEVYLTARQVQNFALAVHELTTNAVKYGALQGDTGRLAVTWDVVLDQRERRRLALSWIESGVAIVPDTVPRRGYGTELIQEALAYALQATVAYELGADGVRCRIEMPVP